MKKAGQICVLVCVFVILIANSIESVQQDLKWRNISSVVPVSAEVEYLGKEVPAQAISGEAERGKVFYHVSLTVRNRLARDNPSYNTDNISISFEYKDGALEMWDQVFPIYDAAAANRHYPERQRENLIPAGREAEIAFFIQVPEQAKEISISPDFWKVDPAFFSITEQSENESVLVVSLPGADE